MEEAVVAFAIYGVAGMDKQSLSLEQLSEPMPDMSLHASSMHVW